MIVQQPASVPYPRRSRFRRLRRYFLVGLVVIAPVGLTGFVLTWFFQRIDGILGVPLQNRIGFAIPGLGILLLVAFLILVGWLVHLAAGRQLLYWWNRQLSRFPVAGRIYHAVSQIVQSVVGGQRQVFLRTVLIPYPTDGVWAVAFVTNDEAPQMSRYVGEPCVNVFVPTTPNPTSGFMLVVPKHRLIETPDVSIEEAMKLIISAGSVSPSDQEAATRRGLDVESLLTETRD